MLRFFAVALLFVLCPVLTAENLIRNASFEADLGEWATIRYSRKDRDYLKAVPVKDSAVHGKKSLFFVNPDADTVELHGGELALKGGVPYTFSWYAKSSKPVKFRAAVVSENKKGDWSVLVSFKTITPEWKRYQYTFTPKEDGIYISRFIWGNWDGVANDASVWLDAIQLEEGKQVTEFKPQSDVEICAEMGRRVSIDKSPLDVTVKAVNYTAKTVQIPLEFFVKDTVFGKVGKRNCLNVTIPADSMVEQNFQVKPTRFGHMSLREKNQHCRTLHFASVPTPVRGPFHPAKTRMIGLEYDFSFGSHVHTKMDKAFVLREASVEDSVIFYRDCGVSMFRVGNLGMAFDWRFIETAPGVFSWEDIDKQAALARKHGIQLMTVLGNMFYLRDRNGKKRHWSRVPKFIIENGKLYENPRQKRWAGVLPDHGDWKRYAAAFASRNKGKIAAYEITNEPNIVIPAENYVEYVKIAAGEIRKYDPSAMVIGGCLTADYDGKLGHYLNLLNSSGALAMCDALSFHPYSSRLDSSSYSAMANISMLKQKTGGKTLWNSELYYLWDPPRKFFSKEQVLFTGMKPHHLFRRFCIDFGEGVMQSMPLSSEHLVMGDGDSRWEGRATFLGFHMIPAPMYAVYASGSALFTGCTPMGKLKTPAGVTAYHFRHRDGGEFTVCWKKEGVEKAELALPARLKVRDLFGNPVKNTGRFTLTQNPLIISLKKAEQSALRFTN